MIYYKVLDEKVREVLPIFSIFKNKFYLAGGTGLALLLGHRKSYDFDFFSERKFDENKIFQDLIKNSKNHKIIKTLSDKNSLFLVIDDEVKVNFLFYKYPLIKRLVKTKYLDIASIEDIACMKLLAISERIEFKDYVDIYYILKKKSLKDLIKVFEKKCKDVDINSVIKTLIDFEEVEEEPIDFMPSKKVSLEKLKKFIIKKIKDVFKNLS